MTRLPPAPFLASAALAALLGCGGLAPGAGSSTSNPAAGGGPAASQDGFPDWQERALGVLTNAVRLSPLDYRARYAAEYSPSLATAGALAAYPAVAEVRWSLGLNRSARAHSADMGASGCFQHDSCDGTSWSARIGSFYTASGTIAENIAAGPADPRQVMFLWLCDATGGACCADHASCDGHRRNIMSASYRALGNGHATVAGGYREYWTQDFGGVAEGAAPPLVDGVHLLFPPGRVTFLANYVDALDPLSVAVVVDGAALPLAVDLGRAAHGTWSASLPVGAGCRSYHFEARDAAGAAWRQPSSGEYRTFQEGGCTEDHLP